MKLFDVCHQNAAQDRIQRALAVERVPHAYLFTGPEGVGKEMLAMRLAAVLLCSEPVVAASPPEGIQTGADGWRDACGRCVDCVLMQAGNHPDYHRIYRGLNKSHPDASVQRRKAKDLSVDIIRHFVVEKVALRPSRNRGKVFVITDTDRMNDSSQNAMLKTLEEPPAHCHIILLSTSAERLLDTTRSRCQQVGFHYLPIDFVADHLSRNRGADAQTAAFLAELSQGSAGVASLYHEIAVHEFAPAFISAIAAAGDDPLRLAKEMVETAKTLATRLRGIGKDDDDGEEDDIGDLNTNRLGQTIALTLTGALLRDVQRMAAGVPPVVHPSQATLRAISTRAQPAALRAALRAISSAEYQIGANAQVQLVFDVVSLAVGDAVSGRRAAG